MGLSYYDKLVPGDKINNLEVLEYSHTDCRNNRHLKIKCHCGNIFTTYAYKIKSGHTKSCGCRKVKVCVDRNKSMTTEEKRLYHQKAWDTRRRR